MKKLLIISVVLLISAFAILTSACSTKSESSFSIEDFTSSIEYGELIWPTKGPATLVSAPKSETGYIKSDSSSFFLAYINNTTKSDFKKYVEDCSDKGFDVDYKNGDTYYYADNSNGDHLSLKFGDEADDVMTIRIDLADEEETTKTTEKAQESSKAESKTESKTESKSESESKTSEVANDSDFRDMVDSYEDFMDEYIDFMEKYNSSDDPISMLSDYTELMSKYSDWMDKINSYDEDDVSLDDWKYYVEVTTRVAEKMEKANIY